jgi:thiamine transport system substrate-binding protein
MTRRAALPTAGLVMIGGLLAGCSLGSSGSAVTGSGPSGPTASASPTAYHCGSSVTVTLATHDSFVLPDTLLADFTKATGCTLSVVKSGDAGALTNKLVLTKASPIADVVYGIDNTFAGRAVGAGVLAPYSPTLPAGAAEHALTGPGAAVLTPVDYGDVCVNVDTSWFSAHGQNPPATLEDLTKPGYKGLFVTPGATTSSPGFAFLLATIGAFGPDGWKDYWRRLVANDVLVTAGWSDAYDVDFTAGAGHGDRPIVLSYASSPPFTIPAGGTTPTTAALLGTCFRQVEYAGVLAGAKNPDGAKAFVDFMLSRPVQESIPDAMYVFPVDSGAALPPVWAQWAKVATTPYAVSGDAIEAGRDQWLKDWSDLTSG